PQLLLPPRTLLIPHFAPPAPVLEPSVLSVNAPFSILLSKGCLIDNAGLSATPHSHSTLSFPIQCSMLPFAALRFPAPCPVHTLNDGEHVLRQPWLPFFCRLLSLH